MIHSLNRFTSPSIVEALAIEDQPGLLPQYFVGVAHNGVIGKILLNCLFGKPLRVNIRPSAGKDKP